jgi:nucleobase:cation symporter-1, NCS1 family
MTQQPTTSDGSAIREEALAGRIPIPFQKRLYTKYSEFLLTCTTLGAASYAYLVGTSLAAIGCTWIGLLGYMLGLIIGSAISAFAAGSVSYRLGVDPVDACKPAFGSRGSVLVLLGVMITCVGWANVLLAMTANGIVELLPHGTSLSGELSNSSVAGAGLVLIVLIWVLLRRGARMMEKAASYGAMIQIAVAVIFLGVTIHKYGLVAPLMSNVDPAKAYTSNHLLQIAYAVEFGLGNGLGLFPFIGGFVRLVKHKRHMIGPAVWGYAVFGCTLVTGAGTLASMATGQTDLVAIFQQVCGRTLGNVLLVTIMITNLGTMVAQFYIVGVAAQQLSAFARRPWQVVAAIVLLPSIVVVFNTPWIFGHVMTLLAYNSVLFVGPTGVVFVDYFILRGQRVQASHLFAKPRQGDYWFLGGVNWIAVAVIVMTIALYIWLFDPLSLKVSEPFRFAGASIPSLLFAGAGYYVLMKLLVVGRGLGGYRPTGHAPADVEVSL